MFRCPLRKGETKDALVQAAVELMTRQSFNAVSVEDICRAAGVRKGTFYHYFPSKVDLALAAYELVWTRMRAVLDNVFSPTRDPLDRLQAYADGAYAFYKETFEKEGKIYGCPLCSAGQEMAAQDETIRQRIEHYGVLHCRYFESVLRDMDAFSHHSRADLEKMSRELFFYTSGVLSQAKVANDPAVVKRDLLAGLRRLIGVDNPADIKPTERSKAVG